MSLKVTRYYWFQRVETRNFMLSRLHVPTNTRFSLLTTIPGNVFNNTPVHANISALACSQWNSNVRMFGRSFSTTSILVKAAPRNFILCRFWPPPWTKVAWRVRLFRIKERWNSNEKELCGKHGFSMLTRLVQQDDLHRWTPTFMIFKLS